MGSRIGSTPVRRAVLWIGMTLLLGMAVHLGIVLAIPWVVGLRLRSMTTPNTIVHPPKPSADYNPVRRSGTDLIYSACAYDLSHGPLRITAPAVGTYMSVSCFALNSDNFYVKNDRQVGDAFDIVLVGPGTPEPEAPGSEIVRSPTTTGGIIFRYFVGDGTHNEQIERSRHKIRIQAHSDFVQEKTDSRAARSPAGGKL
jgi:uncharacterized membrane protein